MVDFLCVNGPKMGQRMAILYGRRFMVPVEPDRALMIRGDDDKPGGSPQHVLYEALSELIGHVAGVVGTQISVGADDRFAIFAHPDWPPTKLDLRTFAVSELERADPDAHAVRERRGNEKLARPADTDLPAGQGSTDVLSGKS